MSSAPFGNRGTGVLCLIWAGLIAAGILLAGSLEWTPGSPSEPPRSGPARTMFIALHPQCPCSRATLSQLKGLLATSHRTPHHPLHIRALKYSNPSFGSTSPLQEELLHLAASQSDFEIVDDHNGHEAIRLGLRTSGEIIAYGDAGELLFSGGITAGRGKDHPSAGAFALTQALAGASPKLTRSPVFGCSIRGRSN